MTTMCAKHFVPHIERMKYQAVIGGRFLLFLTLLLICWLGERTANIFELVMIPRILSILYCLIEVTYRVQSISYSRIVQARTENYVLHHKYIREIK